MIVTVLNPDAPFDSPAYDGEPADAHKYLAPGSYRCQFEDGTQWGILVVTETASHLVLGGPSKAVSDLAIGDQISFGTGDYEFGDGPRDAEYSVGTIEDKQPLNDRGGVQLAIRTAGDGVHVGTLHIRYWGEWDEVDTVLVLAPTA
jgi:hypothetical protein